MTRGEVIAPEAPREILSPAVVRNGFTSFQVVVEAPAEAKWWLFVGQNPENSVKLTMYRELGPNRTMLCARRSAVPELGNAGAVDGSVDGRKGARQEDQS